MATSTPLLGKTAMALKKTPTMAAGKAKSKSNGNIMSFFKKAEVSSGGSPDRRSEENEDSLFLAVSPVKGESIAAMQTPTPPREAASPKDSDMQMMDSSLSRYNEAVYPNKRRRTEEPAWTVAQAADKTPIEPRSKGPFADDSDTDENEVEPPTIAGAGAREENSQLSLAAMSSTGNNVETKTFDIEPVEPPPRPLKRESTSMGEVDGFDGIEDFIDDEFPQEGEEFLERRWMEEQAEFEMSLEEQCDGAVDPSDEMKQVGTSEATGMVPQDAGSAICPICGGYTTGMTEQVSVKHDNVLDVAGLTKCSKYLCMSMIAWMEILSRSLHMLRPSRRNPPMPPLS
jgi:DNA cross-link repair 1A protein